MEASNVVVGAGPAGLTAAYELGRRSENVVILEKDTMVGGLARTIHHKGFHFDIGGHRFFSKSKYVNQLWRQTLGKEFITRKRLSRIYYQGKFFDYPLRMFNAPFVFGSISSCRVLASYILAKLKVSRDKEQNYANWVSNRFGNHLFKIFFRDYTEKVWGVPCEELSADWAAQRIRNLSLGKAIAQALGFGGRGSIASLIHKFEYPPYGPGQMYEHLAKRSQQYGTKLRLGVRVNKIFHHNGRIIKVEATRNGNSIPINVQKACFSSMPLDELLLSLTPPCPKYIWQAAHNLNYRSLITANLMVNEKTVVPDNWIYVHDKNIKAGRIQFYKNWSPQMVPSGNQSSIGMEYFCSEKDELWNYEEHQILNLAVKELNRLNLVDTEKILDGFCVKVSKAYPVYLNGYKQYLLLIQKYLKTFENLYTMGRHGQFHYNNMDHSILSGYYSVLAMQGHNVDPWSINTEQSYLEES